MAKRLLIFNTAKLSDMLEKGNVWYVRHYEEYFDEVHVIYLLGGPKRELSQGNTHLISVGWGRAWLDLALAPIRLWRTARRLKPTSYLTADIVFGWWTSLLIRLFSGARIVLLPVCLPHEIYRNTGTSISNVLPISIERRLLPLSYWMADRIMTSRNWATYVTWLSSRRDTSGKLVVVDAAAEELPTASFFERLGQAPEPHDSAVPVLLYVGRLHPEKLVADLIEMMGHLKTLGVGARLMLVGEGSERPKLERRASALGVQKDVEFRGAVANEELVPYFQRASVFVSTITGTSLREAGLVGLPVVAYDVDWVHDLMTDGETALLAPAQDSQALAECVVRALGDTALRERIGTGFHQFAQARWTRKEVRKGLAQAFERDTKVA